MLDAGTKRPARVSRALSMKGIEMSENTKTQSPAIAIAPEVVDLVRGSLATNSVGQASVDFYVAALREAGVDPESLSFAEAVEVTRRLYAPSADFRRDRASAAKAQREAEKAAAKAKRDAEKAKRELAEVEALKAKLAAKGIKV